MRLERRRCRPPGLDHYSLLRHPGRIHEQEPTRALHSLPLARVLIQSVTRAGWGWAWTGHRMAGLGLSTALAGANTRVLMIDNKAAPGGRVGSLEPFDARYR